MADAIFPDGTKLNTLKFGIQICTSTTRPASPSEGWHIYETDTDKLYYWNGTAWVERLNSAGVTDHGLLTGLADDDHAQYLLLTAGSARALTGDLYVDKATPGLVLKNSGIIKGYVQATATGFDVYPNGVKMTLGDSTQALEGYGSSILLKTGAVPATRLTIADTLITFVTNLAPNASGTLSLGSATAQMAYLYSRNLTIYDNTGANGAYITNTGGNMVIHVKTIGGKVQVVNDA